MVEFDLSVLGGATGAAAWVQAVGSVLALVVAVWLPAAQARKRALASALSARLLVQEAVHVCRKIAYRAQAETLGRKIFPARVRDDLADAAHSMRDFKLADLPAAAVVDFHLVRARVLSVLIIADASNPTRDLTVRDRARLAVHYRDIQSVEERLLRRLGLSKGKVKALNRKRAVQIGKFSEQIREGDVQRAEFEREMNALIAELEPMDQDEPLSPASKSDEAPQGVPA